MLYVSSRTLLEKTLNMGLNKRNISIRSGLNPATVDRILSRPYTYIPRPETAERIRELYETRRNELGQDKAFREEEDRQ